MCNWTIHVAINLWNLSCVSFIIHCFTHLFYSHSLLRSRKYLRIKQSTDKKAKKHGLHKLIQKPNGGCEMGKKGGAFIILTF